MAHLNFRSDALFSSGPWSGPLQHRRTGALGGREETRGKGSSSSSNLLPALVLVSGDCTKPTRLRRRRRDISFSCPEQTNADTSKTDTQAKESRPRAIGAEREGERESKLESSKICFLCPFGGQKERLCLPNSRGGNSSSPASAPQPQPATPSTLPVPLRLPLSRGNEWRGNLLLAYYCSLFWQQR